MYVWTFQTHSTFLIGTVVWGHENIHTLGLLMNDYVDNFKGCGSSDYVDNFKEYGLNDYADKFNVYGLNDYVDNFKEYFFQSWNPMG